MVGFLYSINNNSIPLSSSFDTEAVDYFRSIGLAMTAHWFYGKIPKKYKNDFQFVGHSKDYLKSVEASA